MPRLYHVGLHRTRLARRMIKRERALALYIVVPPLTQRIVQANQHLRTTTRELRSGELLLVVFLKSGGELAGYSVVAEDRFDGWRGSGHVVIRDFDRGS